ncbi:DUF3995 domain-containing protein [Pseudahrensia aquimaris]|uniref:DUF3995 domain-containing protein n=1 Tax=Pseudahrensia aquimaris TaxID=744461 RepID=A0ABW3FAW6_9HYPH
MDFLAIVIAVVLFVVSVIHFAWAFGSNWPADNEQELARMVVGTPSITKMPPRALTGFIAFGILAAALVPLMWRGLVPYPQSLPQTLLWLAMWTLAIVFIARGIAAYLPIMADLEEPFASRNRRYFSPLILLIGAGYLALVLAPVWVA